MTSLPLGQLFQDDLPQEMLGGGGGVFLERLKLRYTGCKLFARKCDKTAHPVTTADRRDALCLKSPLE